MSGAAAPGADALNVLATALARAASDLAACRARFALVGGLAVSVRAESRFTRDVDLAVAVASDAEAEALLGALMARGYRVLAHVIHESRERLATARLSLPERAAAEGVVLGLLFASSGIEAELVESAEDIEVFDGVMVPVARLPGLLATKILSSIDARGLLAEATPEEIEAARDLLRRVEAGGFHRSKSLLAELDALLDA